MPSLGSFCLWGAGPLAVLQDAGRETGLWLLVAAASSRKRHPSFHHLGSRCPYPNNECGCKGCSAFGRKLTGVRSTNWAT
jgi:hypothetical protein